MLDGGATGLTRYDAMVTAIAECARVDEVKDIRDKARALEAYHRQARNLEAEREAANVRLRAERRVGELLKELAREQGGAGRFGSSGDATNREPSPYAEALAANGMSRQAANRYQSLADVPREIFEDALSGPEKATTNGLLARAKVRDAGAPQPQVSDDALWLWGRLRDFENRGLLDRTEEARVLADMTDAMRADVLRLAPLVAEFLTFLGGATYEPA